MGGRLLRKAIKRRRGVRERQRSQKSQAVQNFPRSENSFTMPMRRPCIELLRNWKRTYVRGLDWCNPDSSGLKKRWSEGDPGACRHIPTPKKNAPDKIGVVAVISKNRVIGVCGELPWDIPEDRKHFEALTSGKILIIGRRTFGEREDGAHLAHI